MDAIGLRKKLQGMALRAAQLQGMLTADREMQELTTQDVAMAKGRISLAEEIGRIFDALQLRANQRSVGGFENLLSAVLNDVLPEEGTVRLLTQYKNNSTYLDIALEKSGGLEDIVDGNGGAVTNVVCAGLRFAALSRTANRRLMVLDEPDCWLKPERVPAFVNVISQVSRDMKAQSFFITHHDPALFEGKVNLVKFFADEAGMVRAQAMAPLVQDWTSPEERGVRAIELFNVRRHERTLVPCFPGATAYIGDNNLGKSTAISTAFKVVAYGESDDSLIRHGATEAKIVMYLEDDQRLVWSRALKRSPAVMYSLYKGEELIAEGRPKVRNQAPEWVIDVLGITRVDDLDLQVGNQKSPVFLLNDPAPRRAQILSVGRESSHLKAYMKSYEEVKSLDRETIKVGELGIARLRAKLRYLEKVDPLATALMALVERGESLLAGLELRETLEKLEKRLTQSTAVLETLEAQFVVLNALPPMPELVAVTKIEELAQKIEAGLRKGAVQPSPTLPTAPELSDISRVRAMGIKLADIQNVLKHAPNNLLPTPTLPQLSVQTRLEQIIVETARVHQASVSANAEQELVTAEISKTQGDLVSLQDELGGECPLCGNAFKPDLSGNHHVHAF